MRHRSSSLCLRYAMVDLRGIYAQSDLPSQYKIASQASVLFLLVERFKGFSLSEGRALVDPSQRFGHDARPLACSPIQGDAG
ncbi:hypothetical protein ACFX1W_019489 [Malus domestica]